MYRRTTEHPLVVPFCLRCRLWRRPCPSSLTPFSVSLLLRQRLHHGIIRICCTVIPFKHQLRRFLLLLLAQFLSTGLHWSSRIVALTWQTFRVILFDENTVVDHKPLQIRTERSPLVKALLSNKLSLRNLFSLLSSFPVAALGGLLFAFAVVLPFPPVKFWYLARILLTQVILYNLNLFSRERIVGFPSRAGNVVAARIRNQPSTDE